MFTTKVFLALFALGVFAFAETPLLTSKGSDLATFDIVFHPERVDHRSPEKLTGAYVAVQTALTNDVSARFARLVGEAHLDVVRRYYSPRIQKLQEDVYKAGGIRSRNLAFRVLDQKPVTPERTVVTLERSWEQLRRDKNEEITYEARKGRMRLQLVKRDGNWWLGVVQVEQRGRGFVDQELRALPSFTPPVAPAAPAPRDAPPQQVIEDLSQAMQRFGALRRSAQWTLSRNVLDGVAAFYGDSVAAEVRKKRQAEPEHSIRFKADKPQKSEQGMRVVVSASTGSGANRRVLEDRAGYLLVRNRRGAWKIAAELLQTGRDSPFVEVNQAFGVFLSR